MKLEILCALSTAAVLALSQSPLRTVPEEPSIEPGMAGGARAPIAQIPFVIESSGSYYFTKHLQAPAGFQGNAILVKASNVTIDLNGYSLVGVTTSSSGIAHGLGQVDGLTVRNGTIQGWGNFGINVSHQLHAEDLTVRSNGAGGIIADANAILRNCIVTSNKNGVGAELGIGGIVEGCTVTENKTGLFVSGSIVRGCNVTLNTDDGIRATHGTSIDGCIVRANKVGISLISTFRGGSTATRNVCSENKEVGILLTSLGVNQGGCRIEANDFVLNKVGLRVQSTPNLIIRNSANANTTDYDIQTAGNSLGPIVLAAGLGASNNPHANYSY